MNARIIQIVCALYMVAMSLAAATHWWSLRTFTRIAASPARTPLAVTEQPSTPSTELTALPSPSTSPSPSPSPSTSPAPAPAPARATPPPSNPPSSRDEFNTTLLRQIENLQNQNRDLIDQLAETNRELMKLEFRVDSHSSQFRPLPVTEERQNASYDDDTNGVLPPRPLIIDEAPFPE